MPPGDAIDRAALRAGLGAETLIEYLVARTCAQGSQPIDGKSTAASPPIPKRSDLVRLLQLCERLGLDPLAGEAYLAAPEHSPRAPAQVVLGLGGWLRLLNGHPQVCGVEFAEGPPLADGSGLPEWASCTIHRRDRTVPTTVREYMNESRGATGAWLTHPRRMLRHCALVQCARVTIGPAGDEHGPVQVPAVNSLTGRQGRQQAERALPSSPAGLRMRLTDGEASEGRDSRRLD